MNAYVVLERVSRFIETEQIYMVFVNPMELPSVRERCISEALHVLGSQRQSYTVPSETAIKQSVVLLPEWLFQLSCLTLH